MRTLAREDFENGVAEEIMVNEETSEELLDDTFDVCWDADKYVSLESLTTATHLERAQIKLVAYSFSEDENDSCDENNDDVAGK